MTLTKSYLTILFALLNLFAKCQLVNERSNGLVEVDKRLLLHYSLEDLNDLYLNNLQKYLTLHYYFTNSYFVSNVDLTENVSPFDLKSFDVSKYEKHRLQNDRVDVYDHKHGLRITLLAISELELKLPIHYPEQFIPIEDDEE